VGRGARGGGRLGVAAAVQSEACEPASSVGSALPAVAHAAGRGIRPSIMARAAAARWGSGRGSAGAAAARWGSGRGSRSTRTQGSRSTRTRGRARNAWCGFDVGGGHNVGTRRWVQRTPVTK
jgi:hypothetical protein